MQDRGGPHKGADAHGQEPLRVIIVDDDALARRIVRDALQDAGVVVIAEAGGGREAIELSLYYKPDVVLMDVVMPEVDGLAATRRIVARLPDTKVVMLTSAQEPDVGPLADAARAIATILRRGQLVVLESTTYPGATRELLLPLLEESGLAAGRDFHLAFSPQRIDPRRADWTLRTTPKVVAGLTDACGDRAEALYAAVCHRVVRVSTLETAELSKLLENLFRAVNVALVNELAGVAERLALDMREVVDAAATKPFGFMRFDPGPGLGGQCLSVDPLALAWRARELDVPTDLVEVAGRLNRRGPERGVARVERALNDLGRPVRGARIAVLGVGRKAGIGDLRESAAVRIIGRLGRMGASIAYHDPCVPELRAFGLTSRPDRK